MSQKNFLAPTGFQFNLNRHPTLDFYVQSCSLPGLTVGTSERGTPFMNLPIQGDKPDFGELTISFKVDENMDNYRALFDWMIGISFPESFDQHKELSSKPRYGNQGLYSDATLIIYTSKNNPNIQVTFEDAFPTNISPLEMDTRDASIEYLDAIATFRFTQYKFTKL